MSDAESRWARVGVELGLLTIEDVAMAARESGRLAGRSRIRDLLVSAGTITDQQAQVVDRAAADRGIGAGLRGARYEIGPVLGKGANGVVHVAGDLRLGRKVAVKLHPLGAELVGAELQRFTHEAQVTGQLAHPSIVPVHDLGLLPDGRPFYAMKRIEGRTLADVFTAIREGVATTTDTWSIPHFVSVMLRVAQALAFAHDRGVVHRDVKPANIMVGDYGEVLLLDWGVARVLGKARTGHERVATWRSEGEEDPTLDGTVAGTPAYMPPEQARGDIFEIGPSADVYAMGVVIYEYLAGHRPIRGKDVREILKRVIEDTIVPPSSKRAEGHIPPELEAICMRCLEKDQRERYPDGAHLASALEGYLEGSRRREEARQLSRRGLLRAGGYTSAADAARDAEEALRELVVQVPPWAAGEERARFLDAEARFRDLRKQRDDAYDEAVTLLSASLERDPDQKEARTGLSTLFLRRMDEAEARGEGVAAFFKTQVLRYDTGVLAKFLLGDASISVVTDPPGARAVLWRVAEVEGQWLPTDSRELGRTPITAVSIPPGSWLLELHRLGHLCARIPLRFDRPVEREVQVRLCPEQAVPPGFVPIPGAEVVIGGDALALDGAQRELCRVPDFAMGAWPVTWGEFRRWLADEGAAQGFEGWGGPPGIAEEERDRLPAMGITWPAAMAFADWKARRTGLPIRLPTVREWEYAGRGADQRIFPWGDRWDATACSGPDATPDEPRPRPVGSMTRDRSLFGIFDLAGGVHEWVSDPVPHRPDRGWLKGGSWNGHPRFSRLCSRLQLPRATRSGAVGLRLAMSL